MVIGTMAMTQVSGITCPQSVSRSCCNGRLQQPVVVVSGIGSSRMDSTLRFARLSYNSGASHIKAGVNGFTTLGNRWQRRTCKGRVSCQLGGAASSREDEIGPDANVPSMSDGTSVQFDLNLPRRSTLLEFTCNVCKARTQRMINPDAFRRGTIYVQCGSCEVYHQLVDNLNLVKEYDFKNEVDPSMRNDLEV
ncbi:hypothetical protein M758_8G042200 [Ceratodon purpureus]|nr:hypothetical protein M758_8G042200 [Ceratodon purpureus]